MQNIQSFPNPFYDLASPIDAKQEKRNKLIKMVALAVLGLAVLATLGAGVATMTAAIYSVLPIVIAGAVISVVAVITVALAYKIFTFIRDVNDRLKGESFGWGRLHKSAAKGQVMMTRFLLFLGANPNKKSGNSDTPLHMACFEVEKPGSKDHIKVMEILIQAGANVNAAGNLERCPLHYARDARHADRVEFLVENGAYINLKQMCRPDYSPWEYAEVKKNQKKISSKTYGDPRSDQELLEADKRIYEILNKNGSVYTV